MIKRISILILLATLSVVVYAQSRGTPSTLRVKIDANGALVTAATAQVSPITTVTFSNARLSVDASGNLLTVVSGGSGVGTVTSIATTSPITGGTITTTGTIACATCGVTGSPLSQFASTTSAQLAGVISDETGNPGGSAFLVYNDNPTFTSAIVTPRIEGGNAVSSTLSLVSTNAIGTTDKIKFLVGNNGGTQAGAIYDNGYWFNGLESTSVNYGTQPLKQIHMVGGADSAVVVDRISADAVPAIFLGRHARGTINTPTQTNSADNLVQLAGAGWETTTPGWTSSAIGVVGIQAAEAFTSSAQGTRVVVNLTPVGSVTPARLMTLAGNGVSFSLPGSAITVANVGANSCGTTAASVAGNQTVGEVTVGATSGTQCRVAIPQAIGVRFNGSCSNQSTANLCRVVAVDTTHFDLVGVFVAGDVLAYTILGR